MIVAHGMLEPVYFTFVKTMLESFLQSTHFVKSGAHSPRPKSKIIAMIALGRAILMKVDPVVNLHAHRLFSGCACSCSCKKEPRWLKFPNQFNTFKLSFLITCLKEDFFFSGGVVGKKGAWFFWGASEKRIG